MDKKELKKISINLVETFYSAGSESLNLRNKGLKKEIKSDNTPVTNGDLIVNEILTKKIKELTPSIPIISEESSQNKDNDNLSNFWLIDPIDGTYDYLNNKDEFTLNAGLIVNKKPALGVIYAPAKNRMFYSFGLDNSYEIIKKEHKSLNCTLKKSEKYNAVSYSQNLKPEIADLHKKYKIKEYMKMKSSLKFCVIASSEFDYYFAEPRASEWDIAAGHAILEHAGGNVTDFEDRQILYGKKGFKNPSLILSRFAK